MSFAATKAPERKSLFKKTIDADDIRRRRTETTVQIRKTIKEDRMNQRRRMVSRLLFGLIWRAGSKKNPQEDAAMDG